MLDVEALFDEPRGRVPVALLPSSAWRPLCAAHGPSFGAGAIVRVSVSFCAADRHQCCPGCCEAVAYARALPAECSTAAVRVCAPVFLLKCEAAGTRTPSTNTGAFAYGRVLAAKVSFYASRKQALPAAESVHLGRGCSIGIVQRTLRGCVAVTGTLYTAGCAVDIAVSPSDTPCVVGPLTAVSPLVGAPIVPPVHRPIGSAADCALDEMLCAAARARGTRVPVPRTLLICGPSGSGKTHAVRAACKRHGVALVEAGGSANGLRSVFGGLPDTPCVVLVEDVDILAARRSDASSGASEELATLLVLLDGARAGTQPIVVATTCRPGAIDAALRRPGRLDREVSIGPLSLSERKAMISSLLVSGDHDARPAPGRSPDDRADSIQSSDAHSPTDQALHSPASHPKDHKAALDALAEKTVGYVAADVSALVLRSVSHAQDCTARLEWMAANAPPASLLRSDSSSIGGPAGAHAPSWDDLGGVAHVRRAVERAAEWPLRRARAFVRLGLAPARGVLLHGPPGCSKTTIARIVAARTNASFFSLVGGAASLYGAHVGEAEAALRSLFASARRAAPAVVFLDEIDALVGRRGASESTASDEVSTRVLATLLNEMDGIDGHAGVLVLAATNRVDAVDDALLRPGRFDVLVAVPLPDDAGRRDIFRAVSRRTPLDADAVRALDCAAGERTAGMSGADLQALVQEAAISAISRGADCVSACDVESALVRASRPAP